MPRRTAAPLAALLALLVVLLPGAARATPPERLMTQVTDPAGVLGDRAGIDGALAALQRDTGIQLFVVFVDSFDGTPAQEWTDRTARLSDLGDRDALLAVATGDRAYAYSFPDDSPLSDSDLSGVAERDIEPSLAQRNWSAAVIAAAEGYREAAGSDGSLVWAVVVVALVVVAALTWVLLRRRRSRPATGTPPAAGPALEDLAIQANALLIELDDDLRTSERELAMAAGQYGSAATEPFRVALESSRRDIAEAFRLRMTLDDEPAPGDETRRRTLAQIIELCRGADARLDAESEAFDELRDLEGRAAEVAEAVDQRRSGVEAALPAATATLLDLRGRFSGGTVEAVTANLDQARERLAFAAAAAARARAALAGDGRDDIGETGPPAAGEAVTGTPATDAAVTGTPPAGTAVTGPPPAGGVVAGVPGGDRAEAALAVRAAEQATDQAEQLLSAVDRAAVDLPAAHAAAVALITEVGAEIAAGHAVLAAGTAAPAGLGAAVAGAEQVLAHVRAALAVPQPDPGDAVARLQAADTALDSALAEARGVAERRARAGELLAQAMPVARAEIAAANDFITTRRAAVDSRARTSLSEAERHLALAERLAVPDPAAALTEAQQARQLAADAGQAARLDVQGWDGGGYGQTRGFDAGAFAGAVLGGILSGGGRSRGGPSGGWGGGFGGSGSRRGTGGGGTRRGGGGRF